MLDFFALLIYNVNITKKEVNIMKLTKILSLILAVICCFSLLVACTVDNGDGGDGEGGEPVSFDNPKELYLNAIEYMNSHAYKQTVVVSTQSNSELIPPSTITETTFYDGPNSRTISEAEGLTTTYFEGVMYVEKGDHKKKMEVDIDEIAGEYGVSTNLEMEQINALSEDDFVLTVNPDGTATVEFTAEFPYVGPTKYTVVINSYGRIVNYNMEFTMSVMDITATTLYETTVEYGTQYKVYAPENADEFTVAESLNDLMGV